MYFSFIYLNYILNSLNSVIAKAISQMIIAIKCQ